MPSIIPSTTTQKAMHGEILDYGGTMNRLGGDAELFVDLVRFFLEDIDGLLTRLEDARQQRDARKLAATAHAIKGLCSNFGAQRAVLAAATLETAAQACQLSTCDQYASELTTAVAELKATLAQYTKSSAGN